jgi:CheY-like chemotaxis protein
MLLGRTNLGGTSMRRTPLSSSFPPGRTSLVPPPPSIRSSPRRVLVVDDDVQIRELLGEILAGEGYAVSLARNARQAVRSILQMRPDLALLDLSSPTSTGWLFLEIQAEHPLLAKIPVLVPSEFVPCLEADDGAGSTLLLGSFLDAVHRLTGREGPEPVPRRIERMAWKGMT